MTLDEPSAITRCQAGDLTAFDELYQTYLEPIYAYIHRRISHRETAEDLTSTTFLKALERIRTYNPDRGNFSAWIYSIARNTLTDHYRTKRESTDIDAILDLASEDDTTAGVRHFVERDKLRAALESLDPVKREIVLLRVWEGLAYKDIADIVGKSEGNCKVLFSRAVDALRKEIGPLALAILLLSPTLR
jgi:RNA polymerase sigma-70 factor (ECF subfamily)